MALLKKGNKPDVMPPDLQDAEARLQQSGLASTDVPRKKSPSPALLGGGAFLLAALALGAWHFMGASSGGSADTDASTDAPLVAGRPAPPPPVRGSAQNASTTTATGTGRKPLPAAVRRPVGVGKPSATGKSVARVQRAALNRPGRVGLVPPDRPAGAPQFAPSTPGQPGRFVPVQGAPTPIQPPDGIEGTPGRRGGRNEVVIAPSAMQPSPAELKTLWNQGAAAKQRGDKAAARRAWTRILQLSPGHPGISEAIAKLG